MWDWGAVGVLRKSGSILASMSLMHMLSAAFVHLYIFIYVHNPAAWYSNYRWFFPPLSVSLFVRVPVKLQHWKMCLLTPFRSQFTWQVSGASHKIHPCSSLTLGFYPKQAQCQTIQYGKTKYVMYKKWFRPTIYNVLFSMEV